MERGDVADAKKQAVFIADANVLIDYLNADLTILGAYGAHVGTVLVPRLLLQNEVRGLTESDCDKAGLTPIDVETEVLLEAGAREKGSLLTFYDWVCLLEAKRRGATVLTSDAALLKACKAEGVEARRGLVPLLHLAELGHLPPAEASAAAKTMADKNGYLKEVLPEFEKELARRTAPKPKP